MNFDDLLKEPGEWLKGKGASSKIVISSRVRLARNLDGIPFPGWAGKREREEVLKLSARSISACPILKNALSLELNKLSALDRQFLVERYLISREFAESKIERAAVIGEKEMVSLMINEEDHLRLQSLHSGFEIEEAWRLVSQVDDEIGKRVKYAFSDHWGFLTACPTNCGTGLRASAMLHLPALVMTKQINKVFQVLSKVGVAVRGFYGEGTQASGNFFQVSNQITLGQSEEEIIDNLERIIRQIIDHEEKAREILLKKSRFELEDKVGRAYGILEYSHIMNSQEALELLSLFRLGVDIGIITKISIESQNKLLIIIQPAHLQKMEGRALTPAERDTKRADVIKKAIR
ncbi:MAG: protein arginine kinase [Candidatus Omnitrophica bacterium]|nr:protein arginine kinase [Candidatus Omnitrophota bacterium]